MTDKTSVTRRSTQNSDERSVLGLRALIGNGDRIGLFVLPFLVVGVVLIIVFPAAVGVGGPPIWL